MRLSLSGYSLSLSFTRRNVAKGNVVHLLSSSPNTASVPGHHSTMASRADRLQGALWGMMIGDALAMPVHWYYDRAGLRKDYDGGITHYVAPKHPHPESFADDMAYAPNPENPIEVVHRAHHKKLVEARRPSEAPQADGLYTDTHGNRLSRPESDRQHYHDGLVAGENTQTLQLVRLFMRTAVAQGKKTLDTAVWGQALLGFLTDPDATNDFYKEAWIRVWAENVSYGKPWDECAGRQQDRWSIGSNGGVVMAMAPLVLFGGNPAVPTHEAVRLAQAHNQLTHVSINVDAAIDVLGTLVLQAAKGEAPLRALAAEAAARVHPAKISGVELLGSYKKARGPANIPKEEKWKQHTEYADATLAAALPGLLQLTDEKAVGEVISHACYTEHGMPGVLYFVHKYWPEAEGPEGALALGEAFRKALLANANCGGDCTHRGALLGAVLGAALGRAAIPQDLIDGLKEREALEREISAFVDLSLA